MDDIIALLDRLEMSVPNFVPAQFRYPSILCSSNEVVRRDSVGYIQDAIDNALRLGAPYLSLCPGMTLFGQDLDDGWAQLRKSFAELLDYSEGTDLALLIEPAHEAESTLILTVADGLRMIDEIGSEREGNIDFKPFVEALKEIDYQGFVSGELGFGYTLDPDTAVVETYDVLSDLFA